MAEKINKININDEYALRLAKLKKIANAYPANTMRTMTLSSFLTDFKKFLKNKKKLTLAGRIFSLRLQGGSCFLHFGDSSGRVQAFLRKDNLAAGEYEQFKNLVDQGDFIELSGQAFLTKTIDLPT